VPVNALIQNTADTLLERDMVVILDEADYLKADALEFSRRLVYDLGQSGLVLVGLPRLKGMIQNLRNDHRQLESRIGVYLPLSGLSKKDATAIAKSVWPDVETKIIDAIYGKSHTDVRQFCKIIERMQGDMLLNKLDKPDLEIVDVSARLIMPRSWR
jgi:DNA transposition AAA+ family ATPase